MRFGKRTIGILGGMGPESTADFYMRIVRLFQSKFQARYDRDYPPILIFSVPMPDVVETVEDETLIVSYLTDAAVTLESSGADFISIPCNTAHSFVETIRAAVRIPILSMVEATAKMVPVRLSPVGLLATRATIRMKIYETEFEKKEIQVILPTESEQAILTDVIMNVLGHVNRDLAGAKLRGLIMNLRSRGARAVVLGCTELPLIAESDYGIEIVDPTEILARSCVELARTS